MMAKLFSIGVFLAAGASVGAVGWGDTVYMKDGTTREGTIVRENPAELQLRIDKDGIRATSTIPMQDVAKIVKGKAAAPSVAPPAPQEKTPGIAATMPAVPSTAPAAPLVKLDTRGFLGELLLTAVGRGPDNPARLPEDLRKLWETAKGRELLGNKAETLEALQALDDAFSRIDGGLARLDGISRRERNGESFGMWFARVHWDLITAKYVGGQFDLKDVRESERKPLIAMLREKTTAALEPLKSYFPPIDEKTGKAKPFAPIMLQGISVTNAIEVKKQALYAAAILHAQLKLEPQMPVVDRLLLGSQLQNVNRILMRANELEPAAKAALEKAEREKRLAEERAKRGG
jgi:hypothetical protein